jgi:pimeloyl-ACP methyl ester carboxylesterase
MRAGWAYFISFPETAKDFAELSKNKLPMPLLIISGEKASAAVLNPQGPLVATNAKVVTLKNTGHWVMEENQKESMDALTAFL